MIFKVVYLNICKNKVWLVESVYVMIEVKAKVINAELKDIIPK